MGDNSQHFESKLSHLLTEVLVEPEQKKRVINTLLGYKNGTFLYLSALKRSARITSPENLKAIVNVLVRAGVLVPMFQIDIRNSSQGTSRVKSVFEIPSEIENFETGKLIKIEPENIKVSYKVVR